MEKVKRILTATDFSSFSQDAVDYAVYLTQELRGELYLLHVYQEPLTLPSAETLNVKKAMDIVKNRSKGKMAPEISQWMIEVREAEFNRLTLLAEALRVKVKKVHTLFKTGTPYAEILKAADKVKANLLVLGTHGRTGLPHLVLGSVAEKVVRQSPCPVLTVRPKEMKKKIETHEAVGYWG